MCRFSFSGSLATALLVIVAVPALANTTSSDNARTRGATAPVLMASESSPAGMQERSHRSDADSDEAQSDDADSAGQSENGVDGDDGAFADRRDYGPPDEDDGTDDRGYQGGPGSSVDGDGPEDGYEDGDHAAPSDEDEDDDENDDDSGIHWA